MKVGAEFGSGHDGFCRLDWPASELLGNSEWAQNRASGEKFLFHRATSEVLREARRARADAMRHWWQSLLHRLRLTASSTRSVGAQTHAGD